MFINGFYFKNWYGYKATFPWLFFSVQLCKNFDRSTAYFSLIALKNNASNEQGAVDFC